MTMNLRCSALPLLSQCAASGAEAAIRFGSGGDAADMGSAVHKYLAKRIAGYDIEPSEVAMEFGVDLIDTAKACYGAWRAWQEVADLFPNPKVEQEFSADIGGMTLTGHIDVHAIACGQARLCDYKSGWGDFDAEPQCRGYGFLLLRAHPEIESVYAIILRTRTWVAERFLWTREQLESWWADFSAEVACEEYRPGEHCQFCRRGPTCPAKSALLRQSHNALVGLAEGLDLSALTVDEVLDLHGRIALLERMAKDVKPLIKVLVAEAGGALLREDGSGLTLEEVTRRSLVFAKAWPMLTALGIRADRLAEECDMSKEGAEKLIGELAETGQKGKRIKAVLADLDAAGGIMKTTIHQLKPRRAPSVQPQLEEAKP